MRMNVALAITPAEVLGLDLHIGSHLQPSNHEAPEPHRLRIGVKPLSRKAGMETGQTEAQ